MTEDERKEPEQREKEERQREEMPSQLSQPVCTVCDKNSQQFLCMND